MKFGKYKIIKEIGKGAMGVVYLAYDPVIERKVAIKTMNPQLFQDIEQRERFFREAKSAGSLQHPNIVTIYDMGMEGDTPYIVMEYVEGEDLDSLIRSKKIDTESALKIMAQLCDALGYAHSKGIIHRDIKPSNIRVLPDGKIKIMDFGIAKKRGSDLTQTGVLLGTVSYMAPEQLKEGKVSPQSDQFSAGIVFYEMLTGEKCFKGDTITSIMFKIVSFDDKQLNMEGIPPSIVSVLRKMVSPSPDRRFQSCSEISALLTGMSSPTRTIEADRTIPVPPIPAADEVEKTKVYSQKIEKKSSKKAFFIFLAVFLVVTLGALVYFGGKKYVHKKVKLAKKRAIAEKIKSESAEKESIVSEKNNPVSEKKEEASRQDLTQQTETASKKEVTVSQKQEDKNVVDLKGHKPVLKREEKKKETAKTGIKHSKPNLSSKKKPEVDRGEKEVFSYSNQVRKTENRLNFTESQKEALRDFKRQIDVLSFQERTAKANNLFNAGMRALGNGANRFAAINFYKAILLNPQKKEAYSFLCVALARMRAYGDVKKVIKMANKHGFSLSDLRQNRLFDTMYKRIKQKGFID